MKLISIWNGLYRTVLTIFFSKVKTKPIFVSRQWTKMLKNGRWCSYGRDVHITYAPDWSITKFKFLVKMSLRCNSQWSMQRLLLSFCGQILNILCVLNSINHLKVEEFQAKYYSSQIRIFFYVNQYYRNIFVNAYFFHSVSVYVGIEIDIMELWKYWPSYDKSLETILLCSANFGQLHLLFKDSSQICYASHFISR